ncbi:MAG: DoxX family protein, partial [Algoriphagus sp.]
MSDANFEVITQLFNSLEKAPVELVFMAAATQEEIDAVIAKNGWSIKGLQADATVVKTIMRANPGIMLLKDGVVVAKFHHNNTPDALEVLDLF